jgi:hypothetical protein
MADKPAQPKPEAAPAEEAPKPVVRASDGTKNRTRSLLEQNAIRTSKRSK